MTSTPTFNKQTELASKRVSDLDDSEKIYLLKREIDNLRTQVRESGAVRATDPTVSTSSTTLTSPTMMNPSSAAGAGICSSSFCRLPLMSVFLGLGVLAVARWRRRTSWTQRAVAAARSPEMALQFELQDAHDYEAPNNSSEVLFV